MISTFPRGFRVYTFASEVTFSYEDNTITLQLRKWFRPYPHPPVRHINKATDRIVSVTLFTEISAPRVPKQFDSVRADIDTPNYRHGIVSSSREYISGGNFSRTFRWVSVVQGTAERAVSRTFRRNRFPFQTMAQHAHLPALWSFLNRPLLAFLFGQRRRRL